MTTPSLPGNVPLLVGRDRELRVLRERLATALARHGSLVLVGGEAGIGKTALAEAVCWEAMEQGALVLTGRCFDLTETPAYGPWLYLFDRYQPHDTLPARPSVFAERGIVGEVGSQAALFRQVLVFLEALAAQRPLVLLVDDLHWSDPASLDLLRFLAQSVSMLPLLILVTYRSDELTRRHSLYALLPVLVREASAVRLDLHTLDSAAVQTLVTDRYHLSDDGTARLVTYLQARAEGNAFFVGELLRALEESGSLRRDDAGWHLGALTQATVPPLLRQVIDGRVARLDDESQRLLAVAAIIGHEVPLDLWARVGGVDEDALIEVVEQGVDARLLVEVEGADVRFAHALVREALYEGIPAVRRRRVHQRVAEALAAARAPDPDAVAYHFQQSGDERAAKWLIMAGERAGRIQALLTAADRFEAALALLGDDAADMSERGWLLHWLGWVHRYNEPRRSITYFEEAQRVAIATEDTALAVRALSQLGLVHAMSGEAERGIGEMEAAFAARESIPTAHIGRPWVAVIDLANEDEATVRAARDGPGGALVMWYANVGRYAEARALGELFIADAPTPTTLRTALQRRIAAYYGDAYFGLAGVYAAMGMPDAARERYAGADEMYRITQNDLMLANDRLNELYRVLLPYRANEPAERWLVADEATTAMKRAGGVQANVHPRSAYLPLLALEGAWGEARLLAEQENASRAVRRQFAGPILGGLAQAQGDTAGAWLVVRAWLPDGPATEPGNTTCIVALSLQCRAALLALDDGDRSTARAWLEANDRWLAWSGSVLGVSEGQAGWAAYYRAMGDPAQALHHAKQALAHAMEPRQPLALLAAHRLLGELETEAGRRDDARIHPDEALRLAEACVAPYERALTLLALAEWHAASGDVPIARATLEEVRAICVPLGAKPALARADALASRLSASAPPTHPAGLTAREVEVLRLVAAGMMNSEIAARLFLSERTIEQHLRSIYNKLGSSSRTAATRFAVEHDLA